MRIQSFGSHYPVQYAMPLQAQRAAQASQNIQATQAAPAFGVKTVSFGKTAAVPASNKPSQPLNPNLGRKLDIYA